MPWILFLLALAALVLAFQAASVGLVLVCLVAGLLLLLGGVLQLLARRIESRTRDVRLMLAPELLRREPGIGAQHGEDDAVADPERFRPREP